METDQSFAKRLRELCREYYDEYQEVPPVPVSSHTRMNSLLSGKGKPTLKELMAISEAYDVSLNYLLAGDRLFPSLHMLSEKQAEGILQDIEYLKLCPEE
jgi:transcriptional regulator with XRE-family HTH domain